jgi:hypothetical protein
MKDIKKSFALDGCFCGFICRIDNFDVAALALTYGESLSRDSVLYVCITAAAGYGPASYLVST